MRAEFGEKKGFRQVYSTPSPGQFALETGDPTKQPHWDHCREQFAPKWEPGVEGFYFSVAPGETENVAGFICKTEEVLQLQELHQPWEKTCYHKTDKDTVLWVRPSPFWRGCEMRRSLFTILLRCGRLYNPERDNYEDTLYGKHESVSQAQEYINLTELAVKRFLFGFTQYVKVPTLTESSSFYNRMGWVIVFKNRDLPSVRQMLVLPEGEEKLKTVIGLDAIWA